VIFNTPATALQVDPATVLESRTVIVTEPESIIGSAQVPYPSAEVAETLHAVAVSLVLTTFKSELYKYTVDALVTRLPPESLGVTRTTAESALAVLMCVSDKVAVATDISPVKVNVLDVQVVSVVVDSVIVAVPAVPSDQTRIVSLPRTVVTALRRLALLVRVR